MAAHSNPAAFNGFGDSILSPSVRRPAVQIPLEQERERSRRQIRQSAPATPGVYGWIDRDQRLLYVGKSKSLRHRLLSYFSKNPDEPKVERMRAASSRVIWEPISHELLALLREQELIYRWRPSFNRMGQPDRRKPGFVCVGRGSAPRVYYSHQASAQVAWCLGPILGVSDLREAIEHLNYAFGLRDCSDRIKMQWSNQLPLFGDQQQGQCLRYELNTCLGPCSGACSSARYRQAVERAIEFLRGNDRSILDQLGREQSRAIEALRYERAGLLQRRIESLTWLAKRLDARQRLSRELTGAFAVPTFAGTPCHMILDRGYLTGFESKQGSIGIPATNPPDHQSALELEWMLIVSSWFRKNADQKRKIQRSTDQPARQRASA